WAEYNRRTGKPITVNQLARLLKGFHIAPDSVRIGDRTPKGYYRSQFEPEWDRYLTGTPLYEAQHRNKPTAAGTSDLFQSATGESDVADEKCEKPLSDGLCCGVAVEKGNTPETARCAQCGGEPDGEEKQFQINGVTVWLHPQCRQFFQQQPK